MTSLRRSRISMAALAVYLAVNIGAGALHHHAEGRSGRTPAARDPGLQLQSTNPAEDDDGQHLCLFCHVLHSAKTLSLVVRVQAVSAPVGEAVPVVAIARVHFRETATHSRAPPKAG